MHPSKAVEALLLLLLANGAPVVASRVLGRRYACPLDGGMQLSDGRPLFGPSKTVRGVALAVPAAAVGAALLGLDWTSGAAFGASAMLGDLLSSFVKRRLGMVPSSRALLVDQIPESLLPLIFCRGALSLTPLDIAAAAGGFVIGEIALSRLLFRWGLRDRPY